MSASPSGFSSAGTTAQTVCISSEGLLPQLVQHLRQN